jgi:hypothetical protein
MADVEVVIRIDKERAEEADAAVERLVGLGLSEVLRQERFGIVHGRLPAARLDDARAVPGVASVRQGKAFKALGD